MLQAQQAFARAHDPRFHGRARLSALLPDLQRRHAGLHLALTGDAELPLSAAGIALVLDHLISNAAAAGATRMQLTATARA